MLSEIISHGCTSFRIVEDVPGGYKIWNIGTNVLTGHIPLCRPKLHQPFDGAYEIEADTLLAIKTDGADKIMAAIGGGCHTVALMQEFLKANPAPDLGSWEEKQVQRIMEALPYMKAIKGL